MAVTILSERHHVHTLVQQHLLRRNSKIHPNIEANVIRFALACAGVGLDHSVGEQAMAFCDESLRGKFMEYWLFTDRRLCGCLGERRIDVRWSRVSSHAIEKGWVLRGIEVQLDDGKKEKWSSADFWDPMSEFVQALLALPAASREPPPRPPCAPSEGDPAGIAQARAWLGNPDDRTALMLRLIDASLASGAITLETSRDLVTRVVLLHRNLHFGRGMIDGRWVSPVSANDLSNLLVHLFGSPLAVSEQPPVRTIELASQMRSNAVAKAALSSAVGLASMALLGVGWVSTAKAPPPRFKTMVADTGAFASFRLFGPRGGGLERESPELLHQIDVKLLDLEDEVMLRRLVCGWSDKTPDLLAIPPEEIESRMAALLRGAPIARGAGPAASPPSGGAEIPRGDVSRRIDEAARLMTSSQYDAAASAYHAIAESHPEVRGACWSQIGTALYFLGRHEEAIQWYEAAAREGADPDMMRENVDEARAAIARRR